MAEPTYLSGERIQGRSDDTIPASAVVGSVSSNITLNFNGTGTFTPTSNTTVQYVVVGGGGGGATTVHAFTNTTTTNYAGTASSFGTVGAGDRDIYIKKIDANNEGVFTKVWKNGSAVEVQLG